MHDFISLKNQLIEILEIIIYTPQLHAKWLNTLSFLENCGARKIAACEHPTLVKEEMLKHAAEEFRHAHYLKQQIGKITDEQFDTYSIDRLLGGIGTLHYLPTLDIRTCRYLKAKGFTERNLKEAAYILVTYAIEKRAAELYPLYETMLRKSGSLVRVKSIILEEDGHLREMEDALEHLPGGKVHASHVCGIESQLCADWMIQLQHELKCLREPLHEHLQR